MIITKAQKFWLESDFVLELLNQIPAYVFWKDRESIYLGCNNAFANSIGLSSPAEIIGKSDYDLPTKKIESDAFRIDDKQVMETKQPKLNIEEYQTFPNDRRVTLLTNKVPLFDKQRNVIGILGIYYDITERKKKEEDLKEAKRKAEAANEAKTEFLENMRHDIRTPLIGITGFADIIKNEATDIKIKEYADNLLASSYSLLDLLNEVLEAINVNSGEIPILKKKFSLQKKLSEVISLNQARAAQKKNIELSFCYDPAIPVYLIGDETRIHRIVLELITNALNFTHKGYVKLSAQLAQNNETNVVLKLIVDDTGIGIPTEKQQEIYLQFKRLTPSYEGIYKGQGLGLSIAKQLIDDINGEIYVESQVGCGTKFTLVISLKKALLNEDLGSENLLPMPIERKLQPLKILKNFEPPISLNDSNFPYKSRILLVEDSPLVSQIVTNLLSNMDCKIDVAEKGKIAVEWAKETPYDLIFMDIGLPDIDGYETTKRIRLNELKKRHTPIIALTAHAGEENKKYCMDIGINAVLIKPLLKEKAEEILNSFIPYRKEKLKSLEIGEDQEDTKEYQKLAIFDFELLKKQFGNKDEAALELTTAFLASLPEELKQLELAHEKNNWKEIKALTHRLKGSVSYCGAIRLLATCTQLESAINEEEPHIIEKLYQQLLSEVLLAKEAMTKRLFYKVHPIG